MYISSQVSILYIYPLYHIFLAAQASAVRLHNPDLLTWSECIYSLCRVEYVHTYVCTQNR